MVSKEVLAWSKIPQARARKMREPWILYLGNLIRVGYLVAFSVCAIVNFVFIDLYVRLLIRFIYNKSPMTVMLTRFEHCISCYHEPESSGACWCHRILKERSEGHSLKHSQSAVVLFLVKLRLDFRALSLSTRVGCGILDLDLRFDWPPLLIIFTLIRKIWKRINCTGNKYWVESRICWRANRAVVCRFWVSLFMARSIRDETTECEMAMLWNPKREKSTAGA